MPNPLPTSDPPLAAKSFAEANRAAELALARLSGVSGLVPSVDCLLYGAVRKEALLTSQIEGTQATPTDRVGDLLSDMERCIHAASPTLPPLVRIALIHAQFETIHPFLDGNGHIGRLLIAALLEHWHLLPEPLMYLSAYLKQYQTGYYRHLYGIWTDGDWEGWVVFFLGGVANVASEAERGVVTIADPGGGGPTPPARITEVGAGGLSLVRDAADDAAFQHRAGAADTEHEFPQGQRSGQSPGRSGHREGNDRAEEEPKLQLSGLRSIC